jgi:Ala-tRNA(Pro) deacylase
MRIRDYLQSQHVWFQTLLHPPAPSATRLAQSVHVRGGLVAKAVLIKAGGDYVLAVLPATARVDLERLSGILNGRPLVLATEDEVESVFHDCERGALPPFGHLYGLRTVVDFSLAAGAEIVCTGNARHEGVRLRYRDFEAIEAPLFARFATTTEPRRRKSADRRAG